MRADRMSNTVMKPNARKKLQGRPRMLTRDLFAVANLPAMSGIQEFYIIYQPCFNI